MQGWTVHRMRKLVVLVGLGVALAIALPNGTGATSIDEVEKLLSSDAQPDDFFGKSVAVSGDTAVVGASGEDAGGSFAGAAYIVQRDEGGAGNWGEVNKLLASDAQAGDNFGESVAVSGDAAVVGAYLEDAGGGQAGAAYVFESDRGGADNWGEVEKLTASDAQAGDWFGFSVAASGDTTVVGAQGEAAGGEFAGAAYVFDRDQGGAANWGEVKKLTASDAQAGDFFGFSVAVSGDIAVAGASGEDAGGTDAGAAYVFQRNEGGASNWGEVTELVASDARAGDQFGVSVAVSGDTVVVGAYLADNGGAAYVFQRNEGGADNWGEVKKLLASDAQAGDQFGVSVAVSGDTAVAGADAGGGQTGVAYLFQRKEGGVDNWGEVKKLTASDAQVGDFFGFSVAVSGDTVVAGAAGEDAEGSNAGAAYVFDRGAGPPVPNPPQDVLGDSNCDGIVNAIDAAFILQFSAGLLRSLPCGENSDVNGDGVTNPLDAALILQLAAGLLDSLPA